jgi:hypothetical protein
MIQLYTIVLKILTQYLFGLKGKKIVTLKWRTSLLFSPTYN